MTKTIETPKGSVAKIYPTKFHGQFMIQLTHKDGHVMIIHMQYKKGDGKKPRYKVMKFTRACFIR